SAGDHFGTSVACAGDLNSDGFGDIIVGAFLNDAGGEDAGRVYIFFGGASMDGIADLVLTGQAAGDQFGLSVSTAGDINTDGFDDVIVGAYQNDGGGSNAGRAYIYFGGTNMDNLPDVVLTGESAGDQFGIRVAWAGDVNGDTYDDVIVGADRADVENRFDVGKAYIFFGGPNIAGRDAGQADVILEGATDDEAFASVAGAGDLDNDGYSDVVVGASAFTAGSGTEICNDFRDNDNDGLVDRQDPDCYLGQVYVFRGGPGLTGTISVATAASSTLFKLNRPVNADGFGFSVATGGDVNGDGFSDLLVGAFLSDKTVGGVTDAGRAYLYLGGSPMNTTPDVSFEGEASPGVPPIFIPLSGQFGFSLAGAGDLNGDGISDIIMGAYLYDKGFLGQETDVGRVYIFLGPISSPPTSIATAAADRIITGSEGAPLGPDSGFGVSVQ
ncbi:MAG: integrin alpha, partial [Nitrospiria bacterium]